MAQVYGTKGRAAPRYPTGRGGSSPGMPVAGFNSQQGAYLAQLQNQILVQSQQILLQQQQALQQEAAFRAMSHDPHGGVGRVLGYGAHQGPTSPRSATYPHSDRFNADRRSNEPQAFDLHTGAVSPPHLTRPTSQGQGTGLTGRPPFLGDINEHEASKSNPLLASALARRKRQSIDVPVSPSTTSPPSLHAAHHHRRSSTLSLSSVASAISADRPQPQPASRSSSGHTIRSSPPPALILSKPGEPFPSIIPSEADSPCPPSSFTIDTHPAVVQARSSHAHTESGSSTTSLRSTSSSDLQSFESSASSLDSDAKPHAAAYKLSPFAQAFEPPVVVARAFAVRQPIGPAPDAEMGAKNFARGVRRKALGALLLRRVEM